MIQRDDKGRIVCPDHLIITPNDFKYVEIGNGLKAGGVFSTNILRNGKWLGWQKDHNLVVTAGRNHFLDVTIGAGSQITSWYVGMFSNNVTPAAGDVMSDIGGKYTELTEYTESTREAWVKNGAAASGAMSNSSSRCEFNINNTVTAYGAFFTSASAKSPDAGYNTGTLLASSAFSASRALVSGDVLLVQYDFSVTSS